MRKVSVWVSLLVVVMMASSVVGQESPITTRSAPPDPAKVKLVKAAEGFRRPLYVTGAGDGSGRLFIVEQGGVIRVIENGVTLGKPFLDVSSLVNRNGNERGLLGLAFHPDFKDNGLFFINFTERAGGDTVVARYSVSSDNPNVADPDSGQIILTVDQPYANHNGGHLAFGPDGYLYIALGDGGSAGDPQNNGQNPQSLLGKLLRIDIDKGSDNGNAYGIPVDNPFVNNANLAPQVWAWGLRNPWRFSFDRATGDLYIGDVGQGAWEEINFQPADSPGGENYGWNVYEGSHAFSGVETSDSMTFPVAEYSHREGCSVTGGYVYRGAALPDLQGVYFYADYCSGRMWALYRDPAGVWQNTVFMNTGLQITSFGEDDAGELYVVDQAGAILRFEAAQ